MSNDVPRRTFYEFFVGGGLVRLGLGDGWECVGAVDNDAAKIAAYRANFGDHPGLVQDDVRNLDPTTIHALDLAWKFISGRMLRKEIERRAPPLVRHAAPRWQGLCARGRDGRNCLAAQTATGSPLN